MEYTENHYKGMRTKVIIFIIITLFSMIRAFCKENSNAEGVLSLKEIDLLIRNNDTRDFQRALDELNKYFQANPLIVQYKLAKPTIKTVDLTIIDQNGQSVSKLKPIEGTMHMETDGQPLKPLLSAEVPVEAITQNLASFIEEE